MTGAKNHTLEAWWGGPPGPRGTPSSRSRHNDIGIMRGASRPTGASAADQGVRPTNPGGPVFHGISRAEGSFKQTTKGDGLSHLSEQYWPYPGIQIRPALTTSAVDGSASALSDFV